MKRILPWQVWWTNFDPQVAHEQAGRRPAIVVGTQTACDHIPHLAFVVPCTTTIRRLSSQPVIQLDEPSAAMCDHAKSISRKRLIRLHPTTLTDVEIESIKRALRELINVT